MAEWLFGEPNFDALQVPLRNKEIVLGGCCISNHSPKWACLNCGLSYSKDGLGYLDHELIENEIQNKYAFLFDPELEPEIEKPFELPNKIVQLMAYDFLETITSKKSIGFYYQEGGYSADVVDIRYLDGILIWNRYHSTFEYLRSSFENQTPKVVYILPLKLKKELNAFIATSKWKKNYFQPLFDGKQWEIKRLVEKKIKRTTGSNDYPEVFLKFHEIIKNIIDDISYITS